VPVFIPVDKFVDMIEFAEFHGNYLVQPLFSRASLVVHVPLRVTLLVARKIFKFDPVLVRFIK